VPELVSLEFLAEQQRRLLDEMGSMRTEMGSIRADMGVLTAIVPRQDGTLTALLQEIRALHSQIGRMNDRLRKVEEMRG
jgi:hypothetical protein